ncbi:gliding motility protein GldN [Bacteroidales bacterium OttesenSCG-928-A17]|nr:gliding motility protein GldN [Bacteroidales bacterium OttesenSCG-928-A17]
MKPIYYISVIILLLASVQDGFGQQEQPRQRRQRASEENSNNLPTLTERARIKNEVNTQEPAHTPWLREMYRFIHLDKEANAPLLYPTTPIGDRKNLFTLLFQLVLDGKVNAYNYMDEKEVFDESQKINLEELLVKHDIPFTTEGSGNNQRFTVNEIDIPSSEVLIYMIKEAWYFDQATGSFRSRVIALSPLLVRMDYSTGIPNTEALFWVTYEDIRPYISREVIMVSNYNNALTYTIDDYFMKGMYDGEIIKTVNLMNQSLIQQVGDDPQALKQAGDSIQKQLVNFEKQLWFQPDTTKVADDKKDKKTSTRKTKDEKPKVEKSKPEKSSSTPTRSVRRGR